jgi:hypothetical protein
MRVHLSLPAIRNLPRVFLILLASGLLASPAAAGPAFRAPVSYPAGNYPYSIAIADFNEDGRPDLVVTNLYVSTISILLGMGDGRFGAPTNVNVGSEAGSVAAGDLDGDGHLDVVVTRLFAGKITVLYGTGAGSFRPPQDYSVGTEPDDVHVGDFNRDGLPDLAVLDHGTLHCCWSISILMGSAAGGFVPFGNSWAAMWPDAMGVADFNGDGALDLAVISEYFGTVSIDPGIGDGTFGPSAYFDAGANPLAMAIGDLNADGLPDVVVSTSPGLAVLLGNGDGTFRPAMEFDAPWPHGVAIGDLDGDSRPDLVTANVDSNSVSILVGNGDGSFAPATSLAAGNRCVSVALADLDGDARRDMVVTNAVSNAVSVFINNTAVVSVRDRDPSRSGLTELRPNPFHGSTAIGYQLARAGRVRLSILDLRGRECARLRDEESAPGSHTITWNGRDQQGRELPPGVYFVRLEAPGTGRKTLRIVRLK